MSDDGGICHEKGQVTVTIGTDSWCIEPSVARNMARALIKCALKAEKYSRAVARAGASAVPLRTTKNGAATLLQSSQAFSLEAPSEPVDYSQPVMLRPDQL